MSDCFRPRRKGIGIDNNANKDFLCRENLTNCLILEPKHTYKFLLIQIKKKNLKRQKFLHLIFRYSKQTAK